MKSTASRSRAGRLLVAASALLQTLASGQIAFSIVLSSLLAATHGHAHALSSVRDGNHFDLVVSHETARDYDERGVSARMHGRSAAEDHVVHLASLEARDPKQASMSCAPLVNASLALVLVPQLGLVARAEPGARAVPPLHRRSVVLRS